MNLLARDNIEQPLLCGARFFPFASYVRGMQSMCVCMCSNKQQTVFSFAYFFFFSFHFCVVCAVNRRKAIRDTFTLTHYSRVNRKSFPTLLIPLRREIENAVQQTWPQRMISADDDDVSQWGQVN